MNRFLQLHLLTFFPPANLNRDDIGRPKTAVVGGATRLRLSSQALKRAWRTSEVFSRGLDGHMGHRTQRIGEVVLAHLLRADMDHDAAIAVARTIAGAFGKVKDIADKNPTRTDQLSFVSPAELKAALALADRAVAGEAIADHVPELLRATDSAVDIALFGRMLAHAPAFNREAAAQVAHAITTHKVTVEDDFYTAVDDLKSSAEDAGAGFLGEAAFGSGVFYLYLCIDTHLLIKNLTGDVGLATKALGALAQAAATVAPNGKQNSFAAFGRAGYILAEYGDQQPRTLAGAFSHPVIGNDLMADSIQALRMFRNDLDTAYCLTPPSYMEMVVGGSGNLADIVNFCQDVA